MSTTPLSPQPPSQPREVDTQFQQHSSEIEAILQAHYESVNPLLTQQFDLIRCILAELRASQIRAYHGTVSAGGLDDHPSSDGASIAARETTSHKRLDALLREILAYLQENAAGWQQCEGLPQSLDQKMEQWKPRARDLILAFERLNCPEDYWKCQQKSNLTLLG